MIQRRQPDDFEPEDDTPGPDHCSLLDDYWDALLGESGLDLRRFIDQDLPDDAIAGDLEVLRLLHQVRSARGTCGEALDSPDAGFSDRLPMEAGSRGRPTGEADPPPREDGPGAAQEPTWIGKYLVVEMLDQGGQAQVFRVMHPELAKECALKLSRRPMAIDDQAGRDALKDEARILAQCEHPNLVRVIDLDVHEGRRFVVMEYFKGRTLQQLVANGLPRPHWAAQLVVELARAVAYLHDHGITHQDIKPQNVLVDDQGQPRLIDLGLARQNHAWRDDADDWTGGTAAYMSPEQARGLTDLIGPRTDVFGLGGLLYFLLTGRPLYLGSSPAATFRLARQVQYNPVRQINPRVPHSLERICHKALAADPERRYPTAVDLGRALRQFLNRPAIAATGLAALVALAAAALSFVRPGPQPMTSERATDAASVPALPASLTLKVDEFGVDHYRIGKGHDGEVFGPIGYSAEPILEGDHVSVTGKLGTPAYCYVIALTPDGKAQLYWPSKESDLPGLSDQIGTDELIPLTAGPGLQAFVVLASREQLPPFEEWKGRDGLPHYWRQVAADDVRGVWEYTERKVKPIWSASRGSMERRAVPGPAPFREVCEYLSQISDVKAIRAIAFPVKPKLLAQVAPPEKQPASGPKPRWQHVLQGDDANRAAELEKAIAAALKADHWNEAIVSAQDLRDIRARVQGPNYFETVNDEWRLKTLRRVAGRPREDRVEYQSARTMHEQARAFLVQGKYDRAEPLFKKALAIFHQLLTDEYFQIAESYSWLALNFDAQRKYADAEPLHRKALEIGLRLLTLDHPDTAFLYDDLASNLGYQGKYADAEPLHRKALKIRLGLFSDDHPDTARSYNHLAASLHAQGKFAEAERLWGNALEIFSRLLTDADPQTAKSYEMLAYNLLAQGKHAHALPLFEKVLEIRRRLLTDDHPDTALSYYNVACTLYGQGKYAEARDSWVSAAKSLDSSRLRIAFAGPPRVANEQSPQVALAAVQARLGRPSEAWEAFEEDLSRSLLDELAARQDHRLPPDERDRLRELTTELVRLDRLMETVPRGFDQIERGKRFDDLKYRRELANKALGELQAKLARDHGVLGGQVAGLSEVQAALPADAALIAWVDFLPMGPKAADRDGEHWGVVVRSRGVPSWVEISGTGPDGLWSDEDNGLANRVRTELRKPPGERLAALRHSIQRLRSRRLEPLAGALGATADGLPAARRLIVLPSRAMAGIPVETLLAADDPRTVSYAPSATVLKFLRERPPQYPGGGLLAVGDPVYARTAKASEPEPPDHGLLVDAVLPGANAAAQGLQPGDVLLSYNGTKLLKREDLKAVSEPGRRVPIDRWRAGKFDRLELDPGPLEVAFDPEPAPLAIASRRRQAPAAAGSGSEVLVPLPWTRVEVEAAEQLFRSSGWPTRVLLGADASEPKIRDLAFSGELGRFGVIHLATHAVIDEGVPARSEVILTPMGSPNQPQQAQDIKPDLDGRISIREFQRGEALWAELVTLSACGAAPGRDAGGEGFIGFAQALLMSGARSVVLSLWKADDRATSLLMTRFYQNALGKRPGLEQRLTKSDALREAKQWLRGLTDDEVKLALEQIERGDVLFKPIVGPATAVHPYEHPYYWAGFILVGEFY